MSKLAAALSDVAPDATPPVRKGPSGACHGKYPADLEDWAEVERLRKAPGNWREAQRVVDDALGITEPVDNDKFRYHWRRKCFCWPQGQRLA